eukprot:TRINITY_DN6731_c0_g1_i1.p1 TRINITY_DN6731_c0_g1~~TRINITY_DN6731_c0_g1_i1.p1  ORF type:complete len:558 (+),score=61.24 TRINITY_DN6731_c0_g1_i1:66-1739(+)
MSSLHQLFTVETEDGRELEISVGSETSPLNTSFLAYLASVLHLEHPVALVDKSSGVLATACVAGGSYVLVSGAHSQGSIKGQSPTPGGPGVPGGPGGPGGVSPSVSPRESALSPASVGGPQAHLYQTSRNHSAPPDHARSPAQPQRHSSGSSQEESEDKSQLVNRLLESHHMLTSHLQALQTQLPQTAQPQRSADSHLVQRQQLLQERLQQLQQYQPKSQFSDPPASSSVAVHPASAANPIVQQLLQIQSQLDHLADMAKNGQLNPEQIQQCVALKETLTEKQRQLAKYHKLPSNMAPRSSPAKASPSSASPNHSSHSSPRSGESPSPPPGLSPSSQRPHSTEPYMNHPQAAPSARSHSAEPISRGLRLERYVPNAEEGDGRETHHRADSRGRQRTGSLSARNKRPEWRYIPSKKPVRPPPPTWSELTLPDIDTHGHGMAELLKRNNGKTDARTSSLWVQGLRSPERQVLCDAMPKRPVSSGRRNTSSRAQAAARSVLLQTMGGAPAFRAPSRPAEPQPDFNWEVKALMADAANPVVGDWASGLCAGKKQLTPRRWR